MDSSFTCGPADVARGVASRANAAQGMTPEVLKNTLREEDAVCAQCLRLVSKSIEKHHGVPTSPPESYYPADAVTSTLPRSQSHWDETLAQEFQPFMPMAQNQPRLTLDDSEGPWHEEGSDISASRRPSEDGAADAPSNGASDKGKAAADEPRPGMLTSDPSMQDLLEVLLRDTSEGDPAHFAPWLMARKRLSTQRLHDYCSHNAPPSKETKAVAQRAGEVALDMPIWSDPFAPDLPGDLSRAAGQVIRGCLYPGAVFVGTQRNGRNSYNVTVEVTNVDLAASTLGGYLKICGLTKEWPELTTYFDAEIIGSKYSFVTGKWDATEADDIKHWSRFPEFARIQDQLPNLKAPFNALDQPVIFMRWKEQFLVPDHRVRNINGASFAGFYYICVALEDGEAAETSPLPWRPQHTRTLSEDADMSSDTSQAAPVSPSAPRVSRRRRGHMRGFYFHENSEPYQELSLEYVPSLSSGSVEMR